MTIGVRVKGQDISALLDTGAKPCVMDLGTLQRLGLELFSKISQAVHHGLCSNPVEVVAFVNLPLEIGGHELFVQRLQVLESYDTIFLLGRDFLCKNERVTFDWNGNRVRLGKHWVPVNSTLSGATPLVRAQTVQYMEKTGSTQYMDSSNGNPQLSSTDQAAIRNLLDEFSHVFA